MSTPARKYDFAFSFLTPDLPLALRLADALAPLASFVYSRAQENIATRDGMDVFGTVFGQESRLNVVLYRAGYGDAGWTNFECDVIKSRCLNEGWNNFVLLRTDKSPVPKWVPPTYIYGDFSVMGFDSVVDVLRYRAREAGADVRKQTASDYLAQLAADNAFEQETEQLSLQPPALEALRNNRGRLHESIERVIAEHARPGSGLDGEAGFGQGVFGANLGGVGCTINYHNPYGRVTRGQLYIRFYDQPISIPGRRQYLSGRIEAVSEYVAKPIRTRALGWCWELEGHPRTSDEVAEFVLKELVRLSRSRASDSGADADA